MTDNRTLENRFLAQVNILVANSQGMRYATKALAEAPGSAEAYEALQDALLGGVPKERLRTIAKASQGDSRRGRETASRIGEWLEGYREVAKALPEPEPPAPDLNTSDGLRTTIKAMVQKLDEGKGIGVVSYEEHRNRAITASHKAALTSARAYQDPTLNTAAAKEHESAAACHRTAALRAPSGDARDGHNKVAKHHESMAAKHASKRTALKANTGLEPAHGASVADPDPGTDPAAFIKRLKQEYDGGAEATDGTEKDDPKPGADEPKRHKVDPKTDLAD